MNLISSGGLRPPQQPMQQTLLLLKMICIRLGAAEAGDLRYYINLPSYKGRRTESNRTANGIQSDGERNPIGRRTESDRTADAI